MIMMSLKKQTALLLFCRKLASAKHNKKQRQLKMASNSSNSQKVKFKFFLFTLQMSNEISQSPSSKPILR
jgi:hypothetical protein